VEASRQVVHGGRPLPLETRLPSSPTASMNRTSRLCQRRRLGRDGDSISVGFHGAGAWGTAFRQSGVRNMASVCRRGWSRAGRGERPKVSRVRSPPVIPQTCDQHVHRRKWVELQHHVGFFLLRLQFALLVMMPRNVPIKTPLTALTA
jgi:hypothetical protein